MSLKLNIDILTKQKMRVELKTKKNRNKKSLSTVKALSIQTVRHITSTEYRTLRHKERDCGLRYPGPSAALLSLF